MLTLINAISTPIYGILSLIRAMLTLMNGILTPMNAILTLIRREAICHLITIYGHITLDSTPHMRCEAICHRSLQGQPLPSGIQILAALNPYRKWPQDRLAQMPGLVFELSAREASTTDPMSELVYRVHPIPRTLADVIFDFGALSTEKERLYIHSMVSVSLDSAPLITIYGRTTLDSAPLITIYGRITLDSAPPRCRA
jgi:hypothetical protein